MTKKEEIEETKIKPSAWFFAEWITTIGTFIICFVFLFYQNQVQSARSDVLYEQLQNIIISQNSRSDRLYEMFYEVVKERK